MDMRVDTSALIDGASSITEAIETIEYLIEIIENRLRLAGEEFTSINYTRTSNRVATATDALNDMNERLELAKKYLGKLMECVEAYNRIRF